MRDFGQTEVVEGRRRRRRRDAAAFRAGESARQGESGKEERE
jgi:hypothetical protein